MNGFYNVINNLLIKRNTQLVYSLNTLDENIISNMDSIINKISNVKRQFSEGEILCDNLILVIKDINQFLKHKLEICNDNLYKLYYMTSKGTVKTFIFKKLFILDYSSYDVLISENEDINNKQLIEDHFKEYNFNIDQSNISTPNAYYTADNIADAIKNEMIKPSIFMHFYYTLQYHFHSRIYQYGI